MASFIAEVKIFRFWPKTMDYSQAFWPKLRSFFAFLLLPTLTEYFSQLLICPVLPVAPANLAVQLIDSTLTRVTWELTNQTADEGATALRLEVLTDGQTPRIILPPADAAEWNVTTVPGTEYELTLTASNTDGSTSTPPMTFVTAPDGKTQTQIYTNSGTSLTWTPEIRTPRYKQHDTFLLLPQMPCLSNP